MNRDSAGDSEKVSVGFTLEQRHRAPHVHGALAAELPQSRLQEVERDPETRQHDQIGNEEGPYSGRKEGPPITQQQIQRVQHTTNTTEYILVITQVVVQYCRYFYESDVFCRVCDEIRHTRKKY